MAFRLAIYQVIFDFSICHMRKYLILDKWAEVFREIEQKLIQQFVPHFPTIFTDCILP